MLTLMDNGFSRQLSPGVKCTPGTTCYTTVPILQVDETAKTATIVWRDTFDVAQFAVLAAVRRRSPMATWNSIFAPSQISVPRWTR